MCSKTTSLTPHRLNCRSRAAVVCGHTRRNNAVPVDFIQRRPVLHFHSGPLCPGYPLASSRLLQKQIEKVSIVVFIVGNSACGVVFIPRCSCLRFEVSVVAEQLFWVAEPWRSFSWRCCQQASAKRAGRENVCFVNRTFLLKILQKIRYGSVLNLTRLHGELLWCFATVKNKNLNQKDSGVYKQQTKRRDHPFSEFETAVLCKFLFYNLSILFWWMLVPSSLVL